MYVCMYVWIDRQVDDQSSGAACLSADPSRRTASSTTPRSARSFSPACLRVYIICYIYIYIYMGIL